MYKTADAPDLLLRLLQGELAPTQWNEFVEEFGESIDLAGADLSGRMLTGISFRRCRLVGADFQRCGLQNADLSYAELGGASFVGADLRGASLAHARCLDADFEQADLKGTDLSWSKLGGASLVGVDLNQSKLWKTDLRGARYGELQAESGTDFMGVTNVVGQTQQTRLVPFPKMLRVVGAMAGIPHHWRGEESEAPLSALPDSTEDPAAFLEAKIAEHGFRKVASCGEDGNLLYYDVLPG